MCHAVASGFLYKYISIFLKHLNKLTELPTAKGFSARSHNISSWMKEFAARILISYQFPFNHVFNHSASASAHLKTN
jgi:hypothetical protein